MTDSPELVEVRLLGLPIALRERSTEHGEELMREMTLIAQQITDGDGLDLPVRLVQLVGDVRTTFGVFTEGANAALDAAAEQGVEVIDEIVKRRGEWFEVLLKGWSEEDAATFLTFLERFGDDVELFKLDLTTSPHTPDLAHTSPAAHATAAAGRTQTLTHRDQEH